MAKITKCFVLLVLLGFSIATGQSPTPITQTQDQTQPKVPELPDYKQAPFYLAGRSQTASSDFHPEFNKLHSELYFDTKINPDGSVNIEGKLNVNAIIVFYNAISSPTYAEWTRFEWVMDPVKGITYGRTILRGYSVINDKFILEKEKEGPLP